MTGSRATAPFTIFFRTASGEGGYACATCGVRRHDAFARLSDVFAAANQHLNFCRAALRHRPIEGTALVDGNTYAAILRDGFIVLALPTTFAGGGYPMRVIT